MKSKLIFLLATSVITHTATAAVNLIGEITSPVTVTTGSNGVNKAHFMVRVSNVGSDPVQGSLRLKPILLNDQLVPSWSPDGNGYSLEAEEANVSIEGGASTTVMMQTRLPKIDFGNYLMSVIVNANNSILESDFRDNASDLVDVGRPSSSYQPSSPGDLDLYHEVRENLNVNGGGVSHGSRTIKSGSGIVVTANLWAKFFLFDLTSRRGYGLQYNSTSFDKQWYAISWHPEKDPQGNPIVVDYYSQSPNMGHVPPGRYAFTTLINSRDLVSETNIYNNLHVRPVEFRAMQPTGDRATWIVVDRSVASSASKAINFRNTYYTTAVYNAAVADADPSQSTGITVTPATGTIGGAQTASLSVVVDAANLPVGSYNSSLSVAQDAAGMGQTDMPIRTFVWDTLPTNLTLSAASLSFSATQTNLPSDQTITLTNSSSSSIEWKARSIGSWVKFTATSGTLAPGESADLSVGVNPYGAGPGGGMNGQLEIQTSAAMIPTMIPIALIYTSQ